MLDLLLLLAAALLALPAAVCCLEVLAALVGRCSGSTARLPPGARVAVLIPAHDEALVIGRTLETLLATLPPSARVLVVADNCSDQTAAIARAAGAEVLERTDATRRGKGFALDFGVRHLAADPPAAVVFLDADCQVAPDMVERLSAAAIASGRPVQGLNLCDPRPGGGTLQFVSALAFRFKNLVRMQGLARLAGLCHLTGTGMALPWPLLARHPLATDNVVEDMQLGIDLALAGAPARFEPAAEVHSPLPGERRAARLQRTRWEHGHLKTLLVHAPRLVLLAIRHRRLDLLWLALDLAVPPLALLGLALAAATCLAGLWAILGGSPLPFAVLAAALCGLGLAVLLAWTVWCRQQIPLTALLAAPLYAAAKLPIYVAFLFRRQRTWIRTPRSA